MLQEGGFVLKDWLVVFLIMEEFLVTLSTCSILGGTTRVSANMVLLKLVFLSCSSLSCSEPVLLGREEGVHNKTPCSMLLRMRLLLHCMDLSSRLHMLEAGETPWKQRGLLMSFLFLHKVYGTLKGLASILKNLSCDEILCLHACSIHWGYSVVTVTFFLISSSQICLKRQTICKFFVPPTPLPLHRPHFQKVIQGYYFVHQNM